VASSLAHAKVLVASAIWGPRASTKRTPKVPAKGRHGIKAKTVDEFDSDDDKATSLGARVPAPPQALAASAVQVASSPAPRQSLGGLIVWGHGAGARRPPKAPAKGRHGIKAKAVNKFDLDNNKAMSLGATVPAPPKALAASAIQGRGAGARRGNGGAGTRPNDNLTAAKHGVVCLLRQPQDGKNC
jgi:hypothetical protein